MTTDNPSYPMKHTLLLLSFVLLARAGFSAPPPNARVLRDTASFETAYTEIAAMLEENSPLNFKRAVFLTENAFYGGTLDWEKYEGEIRRIARIVNRLQDERGYRGQPAADHWALFTYMFEPIPDNDSLTYRYDYDGFREDGNDESMMVSRLLAIRQGNCHSLPYLYKILANEVKAECSLVLVPTHLFIRHKSFDGKWLNLETTAGSFSRTSFIMEAFNVSDMAVKSGLYMKNLTEKQSVALCLSDLISYYERCGGHYADAFIRKCYTLGLKHFPISLLQASRIDDLKYQLDEAMVKCGTRDYRKILHFRELIPYKAAYDEAVAEFSKMGHTQITMEQYVKNIETIRKNQTNQP